MDQPITFRPMAPADLPLMHEWLNRPHVAERWDGRVSLAEVREDYGPHLTPPGVAPLDAPTCMVPYLAYEGDRPIGFAQAYRVMDTQADGWWPDETDPAALGIDQFLADGDRLGQGLGTRMVRAFVAFLFLDPRVTKIQTDPDPGNPRAVACYRKAGFQDLGLVDTPDGKALLMVQRRPEGPPVPRPVGGKWYTCDFCGHQMLDLHCKLRCERCGFIRDCSDP